MFRSNLHSSYRKSHSQLVSSASVLGPVHVAAWGLLGTLWDALELVTEAVADAGKVRTAFLLGAGQPAQAKLSSYKTLYLGIFVSVFVTACMFIAGENIPIWLTNDPTLQRLTAELIPLFGIGNIALSLGTMSWTLVGAQGRYRLSTAVGLSGAWIIAIPMSAILTVVYNVDLQGQTSAIVIGYMVSGTINTYILIQSDWPKLSRRIIAQNMVEKDDVSSSSVSNSNDLSSNETASHGTQLRSNENANARVGEEGDLYISDSRSLPERRTSNFRENVANRSLPRDLSCSTAGDLALENIDHFFFASPSESSTGQRISAEMKAPCGLTSITAGRFSPNEPLSLGYFR